MNVSNEQIRRSDQMSPKSSPRGSRSPAYPRPDSSGTLKTTICLGKVPSVVQSGPFYLMKEMPVSGTHLAVMLKREQVVSDDRSEITGCSNLIYTYGLEHTYNKFCNKKGKEELSSFLPHLPGYIDLPGVQDNSSLHSLIEKPPITGKELIMLSNSALSSFRLHPGPIPEQFRFMSQMPTKKKHKHKRKRDSNTNGALQETSENTSEVSHEKSSKHKKPKNLDDGPKETTGKKDSGRKKNKKKKKKGKEKDEDPPS